MKEWIHGRRTVLEHLRLLPGTADKVFVAEGSKPDPELFTEASRQGIAVTRVPRARIEELAPYANHQGVAALVQGFAYADEDAILERAATAGRLPVVVALDCVQDPRNLGAVLRVVDGAGGAGVVIPKDRSAGLNASSARSAAGAAASVPVARVVNLARSLDCFREAGYLILGASHEAAKSIYEIEVSFPLVLVMGGEGGGIRPNVAARLDCAACLPMRGGVGSLNISVAAGIFVYELGRRYFL